MRISFSGKNLSAELSVGITVSTSDRYAGFIGFPPADLLMMGRLAVELGLCAYPPSE